MKKILLVLMLALTGIYASAQTNYYALKVENATYTELTGDITLPLVFASGNPLEIKDVFGVTFNFWNRHMKMDTVKRGILVFPNAFLEVIDDSNFVICDAALKWMDSIDNNSRISYKIEGSGSNMIVKVQWKNVKLRTGPAGNYVNIQIWLYAEDGKMEYRYGPSANNNSGLTQTTGPSVGISYSNLDLSKMYEKIWISGTPPNITIDSARNLSFPNIWGIPANGTVYKFEPRTAPASVTSLASSQDIFKVYPSPANDMIMVAPNAALSTAVTVELLDMNGKLVKTYQLKPADKQLKINTASLDAGNYHIAITGGDIHFNYKVVVSH